MIAQALAAGQAEAGIEVSVFGLPVCEVGTVKSRNALLLCFAAMSAALCYYVPTAFAGKKTVIARDTIRVESDYSNKSARVRIRQVRRDGGRSYWEFDSGGGHWERCFMGCYEAYRRSVLDFWEEQTEDRNGHDRW